MTTQRPQGPPGSITAGDIDDMRAMLRETIAEHAALLAAVGAHRRALGWLLGHHDTAVRAATEHALARYNCTKLDAAAIRVAPLAPPPWPVREP